MKRHCIVITLVLCLLGSANAAFTVLDDGYQIEDYARYSSTTSSNRMVFDDSGNLYVNHYDDGKIMKVNDDGQASTFVSGLGLLYDITWGGGTSFGNYLYASRRTSDFSNDRIIRIDLNGQNSYFASMVPPRHAPTIVKIDRTGNYGGNMFTSATSQDHLYSITPSGGVSMFSNWPDHVSGGIYGGDFDTTGNYKNRLYLATNSSDPSHSGLFKMSPNGFATRFCDDLLAAWVIGFDTTGTYFDGNMFVLGKTDLDADSSLWRVYSDGSCEEFMTGVRTFTFGNDGAMYVSRYNWSRDEVTIARVVPEPATLLLMAAGALIARKKRT